MASGAWPAGCMSMFAKGLPTMSLRPRITTRLPEILDAISKQ